MKANLYTQIFISCPNCGEKEGNHRVDHLLSLKLPQIFGPWFCDECGVAFSGTVKSLTDIDLEFVNKNKVPIWSILVLPPQKHPLFVVVKDYNYDWGKGLDEDNKAYYYNEHTCPTNWLRNIEEIVFEGDDDPHGLFRYWKSLQCSDENPDLSSLIPEAFDEASAAKVVEDL